MLAADSAAAFATGIFVPCPCRNHFRVSDMNVKDVAHKDEMREHDVCEVAIADAGDSRGVSKNKHSVR